MSLINFRSPSLNGPLVPACLVLGFWILQNIFIFVLLNGAGNPITPAIQTLILSIIKLSVIILTIVILFSFLFGKFFKKFFIGLIAIIAVSLATGFTDIYLQKYKIQKMKKFRQNMELHRKDR